MIDTSNWPKPPRPLGGRGQYVKRPYKPDATNILIYSLSREEMNLFNALVDSMCSTRKKVFLEAINLLAEKWDKECALRVRAGEEYIPPPAHNKSLCRVYQCPECE